MHEETGGKTEDVVGQDIVESALKLLGVKADQHRGEKTQPPEGQTLLFSERGSIKLEETTVDKEIPKGPAYPDAKASARDEIDRFFSSCVLPQLSALSRSGRLPDLATCPLWIKVEALWQTAAKDSPVPCDVEVVKKAMAEAVNYYEKSGGRASLFGNSMEDDL